MIYSVFNSIAYTIFLSFCKEQVCPQTDVVLTANKCHCVINNKKVSKADNHIPVFSTFVDQSWAIAEPLTTQQLT